MCRVAITLLFAVAAGAAEPVSHMDRSVCLQSAEARPRGVRGSLGTAFVLDDGGRLLLCTNAHVAEDTNAETRLTLRTPAGEGHTAKLGGLIEAGRSPWTVDKSHDLAVATLDGKDAETITLLRVLATPLGHVEAEAPPRGALIHLVGFPGGKSVFDAASATVLSARVASRVVTSRGNWGEVPTYYATPPMSVGGSGSPAYAPDADPPRIVGVVWAYSRDEIGANYTKVVPPAALRRLVESTRPAGP